MRCVERYALRGGHAARHRAGWSKLPLSAGLPPPQRLDIRDERQTPSGGTSAGRSPKKENPARTNQAGLT